MSLFDDFLESNQQNSTEHKTNAVVTTDSSHAIAQKQLIENEQLKASKSKKNESNYAANMLSDTRANDNIFSLQYVQFQMSATLLTMSVQNNMLAAVTSNFKIIRINLDDPLNVDVCEISHHSATSEVLNLFLDPTGRHIIITTNNGENFYLYHNWKKPWELIKLKGISITSIAWNKQAHGLNETTNQILIGSDKGIIYETVLDPPMEESIFKKNIERYVSKIYDLTDTAAITKDEMLITGLQLERFPTDMHRYLIMTATPTRLYQFNGVISKATNNSASKANFGPIFTQITLEQCLVMPNTLSYSHIVFFDRYFDLQIHSVPQEFAWLTSTGVYCGRLDFTGGLSSVVSDQAHGFIREANLIPFPPTSFDEQSNQYNTDIPVTLIMTEFHVILLYKRHVRAVCRLNEKIVYEEMIPLQNPNEAIRGMTVDETQRTYWIYTTDAMYELVIQNESRDIWKLFLEKKHYDKALKYATTSGQRNEIYKAQAEEDFNQGKYMQSAEYYAKASNCAFEEVALKFLKKGEEDALQFLLKERLEMLKNMDSTAGQKTTQTTLIATWLVKLHLNRLNKLEETTISVNCVSNMKGKTAGTARSFLMPQPSQLKSAKEELCCVLESYQSYLHTPTIHKMLAIQGFPEAELLLYYAYLTNDVEKIIHHWVSQENWGKAIKVLDNQSNEDLIYKYSSLLIENEPRKTVDMWLNHPNVNPKSLIPTLLRCYRIRKFENAEHECIRYLTHVISFFNNTDPVVHNLLITLYAMQPTRDETAILSFLTNEGRETHYDLAHAFNLCRQYNRAQSCVHIYSLLGLYEDAVDLALKVTQNNSALLEDNLELAYINADRPVDSHSFRKRLWIRIAKHIIQVDKDLKTAINLLKQCDLLKMEDILPFFPDNVLIDEFKDEICSTFREYNVTIEDLKMEMNNATLSSEYIRLDIRTLKKRFAVIKEEQQCFLCHFPLLTRQFYTFSCNHHYHADCLHNQVSKYLPTRQIKQLADIQEGISQDFRRLATDIQSKDEKKLVTSQIEGFRDRLDDIVAHQCFMCGDIMIKSVHMPFIAEDELDIVSSWAV
ncbi:Pep3/Vps18/deep orange family-domain-containing protein [Mycotypha africana]|uniref:Pep3/Vps18/deep orange family-domain-containing protein n=1 Tax=Mycotypha africana TaxID=64632 RepID=UPI002301F83A|nr:Pep3/Vps18/deep orange family-domain-containing protein [Mycotypha africana]KAI8983923.1 Pep3/Vps18/deep orange family-domain-containing protein [Mycotypha africana]